MDATPFASGAAGPDDLVVYYKPGCPFAVRLRVALTFYGVPFTSKPLREDRTAAAKIRAGYRRLRDLAHRADRRHLPAQPHGPRGAASATRRDLKRGGGDAALDTYGCGV